MSVNLRTMPFLPGGIYGADGALFHGWTRRTMPARGQNSFPGIASINLLLGSDECADAFRGFWHRMHGETSQLAAVALKYVEWSADGAAAKRYVWGSLRVAERQQRRMGLRVLDARRARDVAAAVLIEGNRSELLRAVAGHRDAAARCRFHRCGRRCAPPTRFLKPQRS